MSNLARVAGHPVHISPHRKFAECDTRVLIRPGLIHDETLQACFDLASYWLPRLMQAIPGEIRAPVILISNEMPDEGTDTACIHPVEPLDKAYMVPKKTEIFARRARVG